MNVGERFERSVRWTHAEITAYASLVGDTNALHHDDSFARSSRFGGLIASGSQTVAYLMAFCAALTPAGRPGVGLEFTFRLTGPARPDEDITFAWEVISSEASAKPRGTIVRLSGEARGPENREIVRASATTLLFDAEAKPSL